MQGQKGPLENVSEINWVDIESRTVFNKLPRRFQLGLVFNYCKRSAIIYLFTRLNFGQQ